MIYLDNAATTAPFAEALHRYEEVSTIAFGNSSSNHGVGRQAQKILEESRREILSLLNVAKTHGMVFTGGATEANNIAIKGIALRYASRGKRIITTAYEHPSVLEAFRYLERQHGFEVIVLPVDPRGFVRPEDLEKAMDDKTILVSVMLINNELGTINDIAALKAVIAKYPKCLFHVDATQAIGKWHGDFSLADILTFSGHKFGAVKGIGGLVFRNSIQFANIESGGDQENGIRPGTVNVAGAASMAAALRKCYEQMPRFQKKCADLYGELYRFLSETDGIELNSNPLSASQSPFVLSFSFLAKKASVIVEALSMKEIYVSSVSACSEKTPVSRSVLAIGKSSRLAENSIRVSFGHDSTLEDVKSFESALAKAMEEVRSL